jgi:hypothetical protein
MTRKPTVTIPDEPIRPLLEVAHGHQLLKLEPMCIQESGRKGRRPCCRTWLWAYLGALTSTPGASSRISYALSRRP